MKTCPTCSNTFENTVSFCPHDGEVLQEYPTEMVGQVLDGQYEVEAFIAQGGMGAVYRARHILLGDRVVIKTLRSEMRQNSEWLRRFQREGRAARRFRHPNAVTVYDLRTAPDGLIYMVMEYVDGRTLDRELKARGRFSPAEALSVLEPVADVLDAAHSTGVVHRDLKPENVMLGKPEDGRAPVVKLLDLGIAKMLGVGDAHAGEATSLTVAGQLLGTPYYMSPEQWGESPRDGGADVDGRTDIYSLGLIFYEMVAARKPFADAKTLLDLRRKHVSENVPALHTFLPDVPEAYSRAVAHALAKDRNDRPATAGEFINELRAALGMPPVPRRVYGAGNTAANQEYGATQGGASHASDTNAHAAGGRDAATSSATPPATLDSTTLWPDAASSSSVTQTGASLTPPPSGTSAAAQTGGSIPDATTPLPLRRDTSAGASVPPQKVNPFETQSIGSPATTTAEAVYPSQERAEAGATAASHAWNAGGATGDASAVVASSPRGSSLSLVVGVVLASLLVLGGVGGWFAWKKLREANEVAANTSHVNAPSNSSTAGATNANTTNAPAVEAMRYWMIAYTGTRDSERVRLASTPLTLTSGQQFKLLLVPQERGYLYIIAQEDDNQMVTLLTSKPAQLKSNQIEGGTELMFPPGDITLQLDKNTGTETLFVVFSPQPLLWPSALTAGVSKELNAAEQKEVEEFFAQHKANQPEISVKDASSENPFVSVSRTAAAAEGQPLVFKIGITHR